LVSAVEDFREEILSQEVGEASQKSLFVFVVKGVQTLPLESRTIHILMGEGGEDVGQQQSGGKVEVLEFMKAASPEHSGG
jgi:hypothetical protein